jgi:adenylate cyclase
VGGGESLSSGVMSLPLVEVRQPGRKPLVVAIAKSLEFGRDCDGLLLVDQEVSRRHAMVKVDGDGLTIEDLGSTNGTTLNGNKIDRPMPLGDKDVAKVGGTELRLIGVADGAVAPVAEEPVATHHGTVFAGSAEATKVKAKTSDGAARQTSIDVVAEAAGKEKFDADRLHAEGGTVTIVFSDIESSTELALRFGDVDWFALLNTHNDIVRKQVIKHGGREIKAQGDGFMLTFPSARAAVRCMSEVEQDLVAHSTEHPDHAIRVRVGIHTGEAIVDHGGDLFGRHIIVAARIAGLADGNQILASGITKEIASTGEFRFGAARTVTLKGIEGDYTVHEVLWQENAS